MPTLVDADLTFALEVEGREPIHGSLRGRRGRLQLEVDDPSAFAGAGDAPVIRLLADELAIRHLTVKVVHHGDHLVTLGDVRAPWWQRRATRSRHIRLGSLKGAWTSARSRLKASEPVLPNSSMVPPATLFPIAPTFQRRRRVTTTHDPGRGGEAHLVLAKSEVWEGERQPVFWLKDRTTIGSDPTSDIVLAGIEPHHAVVFHENDDEFVIWAVDGELRVHGALTRSGRLRTGARIRVGEHFLAFSRQEFADHGRPHGGRIGGEAGRQLPQPSRQQVQRDARESNGGSD
ncbi:hypothetical protein GCM10027020_13240 [Nocardioides salsibiostraticola]